MEWARSLPSFETTTLPSRKKIRERRLSAAERGLINGLVLFYNVEDGYARPSVATLAEVTGMHEQTLLKAEKGLREKRLLNVQHTRRASTGENGAKHYYLRWWGPDPDLWWNERARDEHGIAWIGWDAEGRFGSGDDDGDLR
ncbi:hypothetical protein [Microbacterium maritypicum]|uniref:hypothetical protein n=1 Tax=Microbacterium maritypicum TaxID=33918 RepID=UPI0022E10489|nr:hypothetical protein [Microbacterium liquefaciens]